MSSNPVPNASSAPASAAAGQPAQPGFLRFVTGSVVGWGVKKICSLADGLTDNCVVNNIPGVSHLAQATRYVAQKTPSFLSNTATAAAQAVTSTSVAQGIAGKAKDLAASPEGQGVTSLASRVVNFGTGTYDLVDRGAAWTSAKGIQIIARDAGCLPKEQKDKHVRAILSKVNTTPVFASLTKTFSTILEKLISNELPASVASNLSLSGPCDIFINTLVANLALKGREARSKIAPKNDKMQNPLLDIFYCIESIAEKHCNEIADARNPRKTLWDRIAAIENQITDPKEREKEIAKLFAPILEDLLAVALPNGIKDLGFGWAVSQLFNRYVLPKLKDPSFIASLYLQYSPSFSDLAQRAERIAKGEGGQIIIQGIKGITDAFILPKIIAKGVSSKSDAASAMLPIEHAHDEHSHKNNVLPWLANRLGEVISSNEEPVQKVKQVGAGLINGLFLKGVENIAIGLEGILEAAEKRFAPFLQTRGTSFKALFHEFQRNAERREQLEKDAKADPAANKQRDEELGKLRAYFEGWNKDPQEAPLLAELQALSKQAADAKTKPLETLIVRVKGILEPAMKKVGPAVSALLKNYQTKRIRLTQLQNEVVDPNEKASKDRKDEIATLEAWFKAWETDPNRAAVLKLLSEVSGQIWEAAGLKDEPVLQIAGLGNIIKDLLPEIICTISEVVIDQCPVVVDLIATDAGNDALREEMVKNLPEAIYEPIGNLFGEVITPVMDDLIPSLQDTIKKEAADFMGPLIELDDHGKNSVKTVIQSLIDQVMPTDGFKDHRNRIILIAYQKLIGAIRNLAYAKDPNRSFRGAAANLQSILVPFMKKRGAVLKGLYREYQTKRKELAQLQAAPSKDSAERIDQLNKWFAKWKESDQRKLIVREFSGTSKEPGISKEIWDASRISEDPLFKGPILTKLGLKDKLEALVPDLFAIMLEKVIDTSPLLFDLLGTEGENELLLERLLITPEAAPYRPLLATVENIALKKIFKEGPKLLKKAAATAGSKAAPYFKLNPAAQTTVTQVAQSIVKEIVQPDVLGVHAERVTIMGSAVLTHVLNSLATDKANPVSSGLDRLKGMLVPFMQQHQKVLKRLFTDYQNKMILLNKLEAMVPGKVKNSKFTKLKHLVMKRQKNAALRKKLDAMTPIEVRNFEIAKLKQWQKMWRRNADRKFVDLAKQIWDASGIDNEPLIKLFGLDAMAKKMVPGLLRGVCETVVQKHPIVLDLLDVEGTNAALRKQLLKNPDGEICTTVASAFGHFGSGPAMGLLPLDSIGDKAVELLKDFFVPKPQDAQATKAAVKTAIKEVGASGYTQQLIENLVLRALSGMDTEQRESIFGSIFAGKDGQMSHPLMSLIETVMRTGATFVEDNAKVIEETYARLPQNPTEAEMQPVYDLFKPLIDDLLSATHLKSIIDKEPLLASLVESTLPQVCFNLYKKMSTPIQKMAATKEELRQAVYDPNAIIDEDKAHLLEGFVKGDKESVEKLYEAAGTNDIAEAVESVEELITTESISYARRYIAKYKKSILELLLSNADGLAKGLNGNHRRDLQGIVSGLAQGNSKGVEAMWGYVEKLLIGRLSKAFVNLIKSDPSILSPEDGQHPKQMLIPNVLAKLAVTMGDEFTKVKKDSEFRKHRGELLKVESAIKETRNSISEIPKAAKSDEKRKQRHLLKKQLADLKKEKQLVLDKMRPFMSPIVQEMMKMVEGADESEHPLHEIPFLSDDMKAKLWNETLGNMLTDMVTSHFVKMTPSTLSERTLINRIFGDDVLTDFAKALSTFAEASVPHVLKTQNGPMAKSLVGLAKSILEGIKGEPAKKVLSHVQKSEGSLEQLFSDSMESMGLSQDRAFLGNLWPAVSRF
jgi:hypothetical protein